MTVRNHANRQDGVAGVSGFISSADNSSQYRHRELHDSLFSRIPFGLVIIDVNGKVSLANHTACLQLGMDPCGQDWHRIIELVFLPDYADQTAVKLVSGRMVSIRTCALEQNQGQLVVIDDVTAERQFQEKQTREKRLQLMGTMLACLAHQIRTPLMSAMLYSSGSAGVERNWNENLMSSLRHIEYLVNDMLTYTSTGRMVMKELDIDTLVRECIALMEPILKTSRCHTRLLIDTPGIRLQGNRHALISAMQNLVMNAINACGEGGEILFRVHLAAPDRLEVLITDNGPGIPAGQRDHIFEAFYSGPGSAGSGLGLAVVQTIMRKHGGEIWMESSAGLGTTFGLVLPAIESTEPDVSVLTSPINTVQGVCAYA